MRCADDSNGVWMGLAFDSITSTAYFPAVTLSLLEEVLFNFGAMPLHYPIAGYRPLQPPPRLTR